MPQNIIWHHQTVTRERREQLNGHKSCVIWLTGLSGAGKSTLAHAVEEELHLLGCRTFVLDGDNVRHGLNAGLGFSAEDRRENLRRRRAGEAAKLMAEAGLITFAAFISPFQTDRAFVRSLMPHGRFLEIYCKASLAVCEARDVKGFYHRARAGEINSYTGISSPYEVPVRSELVVDTGSDNLSHCAAQLIELLRCRGIAPHARNDHAE